MGWGVEDFPVTRVQPKALTSLIVAQPQNFLRGDYVLESPRSHKVLTNTEDEKEKPTLDIFRLSL